MAWGRRRDPRRYYSGGMSSVKLSVSLSEQDVARLDRYVHASGLASRSAAIQQAIRSLGDPALSADYSAAWAEWEESTDALAWESTAADGPGEGRGEDRGASVRPDPAVEPDDSGMRGDASR